MSLPIDPEHYESALTFYPLKSWSYLQKKIMYFSSPSSVFHLKYKNEKQPNCIKETAVRLILNHMGKSEKVVIFSLYKDVLHSYYNLCKKLNIQAIIFTGKEKGKTQDTCLRLFKISDTIKVLLTTLHKSSEGFNFDYANHIIILEPWWNPQRTIQAMSRIDRASQKNKNIYIYLLYYNINEICKKYEARPSDETIKEEIIFWNKMNKKNDDTNEKCQEASEAYVNNSFTPNVFPEKKVFWDISNFSEKMEDFLNEIHKVSYLQEKPNKQLDGYSIIETSNIILNTFKNYEDIKTILYTHPWTYLFSNTKHFLTEYSEHNIKKYDDVLKKGIKKAIHYKII